MKSLLFSYFYHGKKEMKATIRSNLKKLINFLIFFFFSGTKRLDDVLDSSILSAKEEPKKKKMKFGKKSKGMGKSII